MTKINWSRVLLGGLAAGVVINIVEFLVNGLWLAEDWRQVMERLGRSAETSAGQMVVYNIWGFLIGIFAVWLYAAIRPRFGPGPRTAVCAGLSVWFLGYLLALVPPIIIEIFPYSLAVIMLVAGLIELVAATLLGAYLYREEVPAAPSPVGPAG